MRVLAVVLAGIVHLSAPHIAVDLPAGWHGYVFGPQRVGADMWEMERGRLANFPLPRTDDDVASAARRLHPLDARDVLVVVLGSGRFQAATLPKLPVVRIGPADFGAPFEGFPLGRAFARRTFQVNGRGYDLLVAFGARHAPPALLAQVNRVLATLRLG